MDGTGSEELTVDELARLTGTTTRNVRALQTRGLLERPRVVGRTGYYGEDHRRHLAAVLRLQRDGFSLGAIAALLEARQSGQTLDQVLGLAPVVVRASASAAATSADDGFGSDALDAWPPPRPGRLLSVVPTTVFVERAAAS